MYCQNKERVWNVYMLAAQAAYEAASDAKIKANIAAYEADYAKLWANIAQENDNSVLSFTLL